MAVYQPWLPCIDEGWTRLVLEQYEFPYTSLHNAEIQAGRLRDRFDCIVLPSMAASQILEGQARDATEPQYTGGIGEEGVLRLQEFVAAGGTLVAIDDSCQLPLKHFAIPVRDAMVDHKTGRRLDREQFYCPGSVLAVTLDTGHPVGWGRETRLSAYFVTRWRSTWNPQARSQARITRRGGSPPRLSHATPTRYCWKVVTYEVHSIWRASQLWCR